jgi:hypothetical protein
VKKELTAQQIFNKVAMHLAKQGKKSWNKAGHPVMRTGDGLCCAFGCLLPKNIEVNKAWIPGVGSLLMKQGVNDENHFGLLNSLMRIHDEEKVSRWGQKLRGLAKRQGLQIPEWLRLVK